MAIICLYILSSQNMRVKSNEWRKREEERESVSITNGQVNHLEQYCFTRKSVVKVLVLIS